MQRRSVVLTSLLSLLLVVFLPIERGATLELRNSEFDNTFREAVETSRAAVETIVGQTSAPGVSVAVAIDGKVVWKEAFGFADLEHRVPATSETKFGIGSISKALTTTMVARLVDEGLLDLDASVAKYLPEFPNKGKGITTRLIAGHLSGLDDTFNAANSNTNVHYDATDEALKKILRERLKHEPGTKSFYSTGAYTVIAAITERITGKPFLEIMDHYVLKPLQLQNTVPNDRHAIILDRTAFYVRNEKSNIVNAPFFDPSYKWAGAGYLSTAKDMARFGASLLSSGFLKAETIEELFTPLQTSRGENTGFGLGWRVGAESGFGYNWIIGPDSERRRIVHQPGGGTGISCWIVMERDKKLVAVILSNLTGAPVGGKVMDTVIESFLKVKP